MNHYIKAIGVLGLLWWTMMSCDPQAPGKEGKISDGGSETIQDASAPRELPPEPAPFACTMPEVPGLKVDAKNDKFALTMFHYNLEYVVNGLNGTDKYASFCGETCDAWDNDRVEDWIIRESFAPVVDFYLKHPQWKVNFEMQGYMLEVIARRFPELLTKLRTLTGRGQMEISSFHYSDQLFLAYPREDLERSIKITREIFKRYCIPLSGVVFNQEGQAGEGRQKVLVKQGYTIGVFPKNLFKYSRGDKAVPWPYYKQYGGHVIVGPGDVDAASKIKVGWLFFDDGELLVIKKKLNPYFAPTAQFDPNTLKEYQKKIEDFVARGYKIASISEYVEHLKAKKVEAKPAPKLLDGTWQPKSTSSIHRWLGGSGLFAKDERDNLVRSGNVRARHRLRAAELLYLEWKKKKGVDPWMEYRLSQVWRRMLRAQISDASGVNPWRGEIFWGLMLNDEVLKAADAMLKDLKARLKAPHVEIDLQSGAVKVLDDAPKPPQYPVVQMPLKDFKVVAKGRTQKITAFKIADGHFRIEIQLGDGQDPTEGRQIKAVFPRMVERIIYSPGLMEDELVDYPMSDFEFQTKEVFLPLSNGLIGLGEDWFAIKHTQTNHLAARVPSEEKVIEFIDNTQPWDQKVTWYFDLFKGKKEDALNVALKLNIYPKVVH